MGALVSLLVTIGLSLLVTRVASIALAMTGLSHDLAKFQARSAFTGVGFTTSEAEKVVAHPVRRRILMLLMLLGNAGGDVAHQDAMAEQRRVVSQQNHSDQHSHQQEPH